MEAGKWIRTLEIWFERVGWEEAPAFKFKLFLYLTANEENSAYRNKSIVERVGKLNQLECIFDYYTQCNQILKDIFQEELSRDSCWERVRREHYDKPIRRYVTLLLDKCDFFSHMTLENQCMFRIRRCIKTKHVTGPVVYPEGCSIRRKGTFESPACPFYAQLKKYRYEGQVEGERLFPYSLEIGDRAPP